MKLQELLKEEHKEGRKEGRAEMVFDLINDKTITLEKGAEKLGITPQELKKQMDGYV